MSLFVLTETSAGYALLKSKDKKLLKRDDLAEQLEKVEDVCSLLKLKHFEKFDSAAAALEEVSSLVEGKVTPLLSNLLNSIKDEQKASLAVADPKLGNAINKLPQFSVTPISDSSTTDLYRAIRANLTSLIPGLQPEELATTSLGLSHSISRHKLKFSPDKVDTMIIQAIALLDDLDKELNTYAMRVKEWYGWHFPEMAKIINDNLAYAKVILKMGYRTEASSTDFADILPEEIETSVKSAAEISMGSEINSDDLENIQALAEQVVEFTEYRQQLSSYLSARMLAIAPNLTALVGDLVGARLIAHAGSLMNLAKCPASTIQILGAEKALFRALKTKHDTPKYGLLYHASLVGQATGRNKGKIARMLATKTTLGLRVDALADWGVEGKGEKREPTDEEKMELGVENRIKIERRLRALEGKPLGPRGVAIGPNSQSQPGKFEVKESRNYNTDADGVAPLSNGTSKKVASAPAPKLIEEIASEAEDDSDSDVHMNGTNGHSKSEEDMSKSERKAAKALRKAERAAKREAKAARKAAKEGKVNGDSDSKKRKHDADADEKSEKKKKKHKS